MRVLCVVLLPVGLLGLVDALLLDDPSAPRWWHRDGGVLVLSIAAVIIGVIGLVALLRRTRSDGSGDSVDARRPD